MGYVPDEAPRWDDWLRGRMFDRRVVVLNGTLDDACSSRLAAELMTLDATGDEPVRMMVDSGDGTLEAALTLIDVVDLLGVPVHATCVGRADGAALGVFAVAARRIASPHARFRCCEPPAAAGGRATDVANWAEHRRAQVEQYACRLAAALGRPAEEVLRVLREGRYLDAAEAVRFGIVDEIARPAVASVHALDPTGLGFRRR